MISVLGYFSALRSFRTGYMLKEEKSVNGHMFTKIDPMIESVFCTADDCQIKGDYEVALRFYKQIIEKDPGNCRAF